MTKSTTTHHAEAHHARAASPVPGAPLLRIESRPLKQGPALVRPRD